jgi:hypothetical protein
MKFKVKDAHLRVIIGRNDVICAWQIRDGYLFASEKEVGVFQRTEFGAFLETLDVALGEVLREQAQVIKGQTLATIKLGHFTFLVSVPFDWEAGHYLVTIHDGDHNVLFSFHRDTVMFSELYTKVNDLSEALRDNETTVEDVLANYAEREALHPFAPPFAPMPVSVGGA